MQFDQPVHCPLHSVVIGSRLDTDVGIGADDAKNKSCRLAFYGRLVELLDASDPNVLARIRIYKPREKTGTVDRLSGKPDAEGKVQAIVGRGLFQKGTDLSKFVGLQLLTPTEGEVGVIESAFGSSGKFNVRFRGGTTVAKGATLTLQYRRYVFEPMGTDKRAMKQVAR
jgi:selenocysteine-specific elongation factor